MKAAALVTIVFLHGGAWLGGSGSQYKSLADNLERSGAHVVLADYRLAPAHQHPAPIEDLEKTLAKIPSGPIFLVGHSAGAHMIAFWNTAHTNARVKGFIGIEGIYDLPALVKTWPTYQDWFIAKEFGAPSNYAAASPALLKPKSLAPWLVIHSAKDELVDLAQSENFVKHLKAERAPVEFLKLKTDSHFGAVEALSTSTSDVSKAVVKFIESHRSH